MWPSTYQTPTTLKPSSTMYFQKFSSTNAPPHRESEVPKAKMQPPIRPCTKKLIIRLSTSDGVGWIMKFTNLKITLLPPSLIPTYLYFNNKII